MFCDGQQERQAVMALNKHPQLRTESGSKNKGHGPFHDRLHPKL